MRCCQRIRWHQLIQPRSSGMRQSRGPTDSACRRRWVGSLKSSSGKSISRSSRSSLERRAVADTRKPRYRSCSRSQLRKRNAQGGNHSCECPSTCYRRKVGWVRTGKSKSRCRSTLCLSIRWAILRTCKHLLRSPRWSSVLRQYSLREICGICS
jgi:hypothetical protein